MQLIAPKTNLCKAPVGVQCLCLRSCKKDASELLEYLIILSITVAGMMHAQWWAAVAGACILTLVSIMDRRERSASPARVEGFAEGPFANIVTLANSSVAATAAFLLGRATAWLWGI